MCFIIQNITPLKNQHAWKLVKENRMSPVRSTRYTKGATVRAKGLFIQTPDEPSKGGIYVYLTKLDAQRAKEGHIEHVPLILKVSVNPKDFISSGKLYSCSHKGVIALKVATYKKVKVLD